MVLDLREQDHPLDSMSIELLLRLHGELTATGAELVVVRGPRAVNRIFDLIGARARALPGGSSVRQTVRSVTGKPLAAALARMPWTVGPSSLHAPAHRRLTMPSALPLRDVDERSARVTPVDRAGDVVELARRRSP